MLSQHNISLAPAVHLSHFQNCASHVKNQKLLTHSIIRPLPYSVFLFRHALFLYRQARLQLKRLQVGLTMNQSHVQATKS